MSDYLEITTHKASDDFDLFANIVNQGIDARLTAFVKSTFSHRTPRYFFNFHKDEMEILMRRLSKIAIDDLNAEQWENDILLYHYGIETI